MRSLFLLCLVSTFVFAEDKLTALGNGLAANFRKSEVLISDGPAADYLRSVSQSLTRALEGKSYTFTAFVRPNDSLGEIEIFPSTPMMFTIPSSLFLRCETDNEFVAAIAQAIGSSMFLNSAISPARGQMESAVQPLIYFGMIFKQGMPAGVAKRIQTTKVAGDQEAVGLMNAIGADPRGLLGYLHKSEAQLSASDPVLKPLYLERIALLEASTNLGVAQESKPISEAFQAAKNQVLQFRVLSLRTIKNVQPMLSKPR